MSRPREFDEDQVLDRALETFWSGSYATTSTQDLCAATGLSRSSLYNTFSTKSELYERSLIRYSEIIGSSRASYVDRDGPAREIIAALLLDILTDQCASPGRRVCMAVSAAVDIGRSDTDIAAVTRGNFAEMRELLRELIARGQDDGSVASERPAAELAVVIHAALLGFQVASRVRVDDDPPVNDAVAALVALI